MKFLKDGQTIHSANTSPRQARQTRRNHVFVEKHEEGWTGFFFWMAMAGLPVAVMAVMINSI